jgi:TPP-dependent pyruvate/acetoin dehydrogenase alpha subunit
MAEASFENPLIPHAKLRQIYLAMLHARLLEKSLPASRRGRAIAPKPIALGTTGLEASLAAPAALLESGDLISDALTGGTVDFLRGASLEKIFHPSAKPSRRRAAVADGGKASPLSAAATAPDRLWTALGAAQALKAAHELAKQARAKSENAESAPEPQLSTVVAYVRPGEIAPVAWHPILTFASAQILPILFVLLPSPAKPSGTAALASKLGVPGIPVDGTDAIALYRVAQESIVRARMGGGPALMECVPFLLAGTKPKPADALTTLERYLLQRKVATRLWMDKESKAFSRLLAAEKAAS